MRLIVTVQMGNDAMQVPADVALAVIRVGVRLMDADTLGAGIIKDENGNYVGNWRFVPDDDE
jgi:hypothetical protein